MNRRPIFGDILARIILVAILFYAVNAHAAINPGIKPSLNREETAKGAIQLNQRCMEAITRQRFTIGSDGKLRKAGGLMIYIVPCR